MSLVQKIAIYGGTFNPVHKGHVGLVEKIDAEMHFDKIIVVPTKVPPHKKPIELIDGKYRLEMCRLAFSQNLKVEVSDMELVRPSESYTYLTLQQVQNQYPEAEIYYLMGTDMFLTLDEWKCPEKIYEIAVLCAMARNNGEYEQLKKQKKQFDMRHIRSRIFDLQVTRMSSSEIREKLKRDEDVTDYLDFSIIEYIRKNGLYGLNFAHYKDILKQRLSPQRYQHSLNVAKEAKRLAQRYKEDPLQAELAGLLHDICKEEKKELQLQRILNFGIILDSILLKSPSLWHGIAGAVFIQTELGINNAAIYNAVRYHTSAKKDMTELEKIIYLADLTSEDRIYPDVDMMRKLVDKDLDLAMKHALQFIVGDLKKKQLPICKDTLEAYQQYVIQSKEALN